MLRTLVLLALVLAYSATPVFAQTRRSPHPAPPLSKPAGEKGLVDLERRVLAAIREHDAATLDGLLAPDFLYIAPHKRDLNRQQFLAEVRSSQLEIEWMGADEMKIHLYGDIAVITGVQNTKVRSPKGELISGETAFTDVFRRMGGEWQLALAFAADLLSPPAVTK